MPTILLGFLLPWTWGISSCLLQQSPDLGHGVAPLGHRPWPWKWSSSSSPHFCAAMAAAVLLASLSILQMGNILNTFLSAFWPLSSLLLEYIHFYSIRKHINPFDVPLRCKCKSFLKVSFQPGMSLPRTLKASLWNALIQENSTSISQFLWEIRHQTSADTLLQVINIKLPHVMKVVQSLLLKFLPDLHTAILILVFGDQC